MNEELPIDDDETTIYDLVYKLDHKKINRCEAMDPILAKKITNLDKLNGLAYYINKKDLVPLFPQTKKKINEIIIEEINSNHIDFWNVRNIEKWLDSSLHNNFAKRYIENDGWEISWVVDNIQHIDDDLRIQVLSKLVDKYKNSKKNVYKINHIDRIFKKLEIKNNIETASKLLSESTPALQACLLSRSDLGEEYTMKGLKSISKLSRQRNIAVKIDFEALKNLGPRSRLDAMKQLLGISNGYYSGNKNIPFQVIPSKDDVASFLFPCSIKYNEEVSKVLKIFEELTKNQNNNSDITQP